MKEIVFYKTVITLLSLTLFFVLCCLAFLILTYYKPDVFRLPKKSVRHGANEAKPVRNIARDAVVAGIARYAAEFDGLYEGLYQSAQSRDRLSTDAYEEWCDRAGQSNDELFSAAFRTLFTKRDIEDETRCRAKFEQLLACVADAGIARDRDTGTICAADETLSLAYIDVGGEKPKIGVEYTIIKSAWLRDGKVVEYGMAMPGTAGV